MDRVTSRAAFAGENGNPVFVGPPCRIVGTDDSLTGDAREILWHNSSTNETQVWFMSRRNVTGRATVLGEDGRPAFVGPPWSIVETSFVAAPLLGWIWSRFRFAGITYGITESAVNAAQPVSAAAPAGCRTKVTRPATASISMMRIATPLPLCRSASLAQACNASPNRSSRRGRTRRGTPSVAAPLIPASCALIYPTA